MPVDSPIGYKPLKEIKQMLDVEKDSTSKEENTFPTFYPKPSDGIATTALYNSGAEIQLISKEFQQENNPKIHPIEKLTECSTMSGDILGYEGFVEVNVQIPGRDFSEDHLFVVTSEISHQKEIPVAVGTYFIASLSEYLKTLEKDVFDELEQAIQQAYYSGEEAAKIREKYGCEPNLSPFMQVREKKFMV